MRVWANSEMLRTRDWIHFPLESRDLFLVQHKIVLCSCGQRKRRRERRYENRQSSHPNHSAFNPEAVGPRCVSLCAVRRVPRDWLESGKIRAVYERSVELLGISRLESSFPIKKIAASPSVGSKGREYYGMGLFERGKDVSLSAYRKRRRRGGKDGGRKKEKYGRHLFLSTGMRAWNGPVPWCWGKIVSNHLTLLIKNHNGRYLLCCDFESESFDLLPFWKTLWTHPRLLNEIFTWVPFIHSIVGKGNVAALSL